MLQNFWADMEEKAYGLISPILLIYIFFQPFNHFAGIRNIAFYAMLLLFLTKAIRKGIDINWRDGAVSAFVALLAAILISILFSNYLTDSLNAFRKNFFSQGVVFFAILTEFRAEEKLKRLFYAIILSFVVVTLVIFIKNPPNALFNILEAKKNKGSFLGGYALNAAFYIPFTLGYLFSVKDKITMRVFLWVMLLMEFALVWLYYSSRTTLVAILFSAIVMILASKRYKTFVAMLVVFIAIAGGSFLKKPELFERHKSLLSYQTYITRDGLSGRNYIWSGAIDMIKARPFIGYGYGWKKIATVAREEGYLEKWKEKKPDTYRYFNEASYGSANPHNLTLQILFEVGMLGLLAFILFWVTVIIKIVRAASHGGENESYCFVKYGAAGVIVSYFLINLANGLWEESYGVMTFAFAAIVMVSYEQNRRANG